MTEHPTPTPTGLLGRPGSPGTATVIRGNARHLPLADNTVDLVVSSPPYWSLRAYQDNGETYDGQIGAEPTPSQYVDSLIEVTAECMRVLKPSGSIWINLGDKMSSGEPYDNTLTVGDAAWLAGLIDADGTITVRRTQQPTMRAVTYEGIVAVEQIDRDAVERAAAITGRGAICEVNRTNSRSKMYRWTASTQQARWIAERIWPWLRIKQRQALAIVELGRHRETCQARGRYAQIKPEWVEYRELICSAVRAWNQREPHDWTPPLLPVVELPTMPRRVPPKSLTGLPWRYALRCIDDLGLILRAEVILDKRNGLPESVTDRVRRSHEQVFHFVKEPRYFSAVDEVRTPHRSEPGREGQGALGGQKSLRPVGPNSGSYNALGALPGSVWPYVSEPFQPPAHLGVDHFAAFASELPRRIILGWSPAGVCTGCGQGRRPVVAYDGPHELAPLRVLHEWDLVEWARLFSAWWEASGLTRADMVPHFPHYKNPDSIKAQFSNWERGKNVPQEFDWAILCRVLGEPTPRLHELVTQTELRPVRGGNFQASDGARKSGGTGAKQFHHKEPPARTVTGYACACPEPSAPTTPGVILDPFGGTGTTALVAKALGRHGISVDMSLDYGRLAKWRVNDLDQLAKVQGIRRSDQARLADGLDMDTLFDFDGGAA